MHDQQCKCLANRCSTILYVEMEETLSRYCYGTFIVKDVLEGFWWLRRSEIWWSTYGERGNRKSESKGYKESKNNCSFFLLQKKRERIVLILLWMIIINSSFQRFVQKETFTNQLLFENKQKAVSLWPSYQTYTTMSWQIQTWANKPSNCFRCWQCFGRIEPYKRLIWKGRTSYCVFIIR